MSKLKARPLDPRTKPCPRCKGGGLSYLTADSHSLCENCHGTGRVPLHPTPTVEVAYNNWQTGKQRQGWVYEIRMEGRWGWRGPYPTEADALRAARLAYLGAELWEGESGKWHCEINLRGCYHGPTADDAILAAFAAREEQSGE